MMKNSSISIQTNRFVKLSICLLLLLFSGWTIPNPNANFPDREVSLQEKIGEMILIGFRGTTLNPNMHVVDDIQKLGISGVILFDYDVSSKSYKRNIENSTQLKKLITDLHALTERKIFVAIDQEGGKVNRLKERYGFPTTVSMKYIGKTDLEDTTRHYAHRTASLLKELGFNLNFAPCIDLDMNPDCPVIGKIGRSIGIDSAKVTRHALWWIEEHAKMGILSCVKHFPGHGSSTVDTHLGIADITHSWSETELAPYRQLIKANTIKMVMTSHIFHEGLDSEYPATMSPAILTGILREQLGFEGVIISDDLAMGAMAENYSLENIIEKSIQAGADLLCFSNNGKTYDPHIAQKAIDIILNLVKENKISEQRINESYQRIIALKQSK